MLQERNHTRTMQASIWMPAALLFSVDLARSGGARRLGISGAQKA